MKHCFIYSVTNKLNNKQYCGYHMTTDINDNYFGSGVYIRKAIKKFGKENFVREIMEHCTVDNVLSKEAEWIKKLDCKHPNGYNLTDGGIGSPGRVMKEETREKLRKARLNTTASDETKQKMSNTRKGRKPSQETINKWKKSHEGYVCSQETKDKIGKKAKERLSDPTKNPMYGKKQSEQSKQKSSEKAKIRLQDKTNHPLYGKGHSELAKQRIKMALKLRPKKECPYCNGHYVGPMFSRWHGEKCKKARISSGL